MPLLRCAFACARVERSAFLREVEDARILFSMPRRLGLASLVVVAFAFAGGSAGPTRPLQSVRLVVSVAWLHAPQERAHELRAVTERVAPPAIIVSWAPQSDGFRSFPLERWLFQRPPPAGL